VNVKRAHQQAIMWHSLENNDPPELKYLEMSG